MVFNTKTCAIINDTNFFSKIYFTKMAGGARRDRTDDLRLAKPALSQLSYGPKISKFKIDHLVISKYNANNGGPG